MPTPPDDIMNLLAGYALGTLEPDEIARVSTLLAEQPELHPLLAELRATADALPYGLPEAAPPPDLRQRTLDFATGRAPRRAAARAGVPRRITAWIASLGTLAAIAIVAAVVGWAQFLGASSSASQLRGEVAAAQAELGQLQQQISAARRVLAALEGAGGQGAVLETSAGQTLLVAKLPPLEPGRTYQLWRIEQGGAPASAGLFSVDARGFGQADLSQSQPQAGDIIAVTNEPSGGSPGPTTEPLIVGTSAVL